MTTTNNIDVVRGIYAALVRQDLAALVNVTAPEVTISQTDALPWGGEFRGMEGLKTFLGHLLRDVRSEVRVEESFEAGSQVVVIGRTIGVTAAGRVPFDVRVVHVWTVRAGKVVRFEPFIDTPAMLRALGAG